MLGLGLGLNKTKNSSKSVFQPSDVAGLSLWLDANSGVTLSDTDKIDQWDDLSGNNNHAVKVSDPLRPTYVTNYVNGHAAVLFPTGVLTYLTITGGINHSGEFTVFLAARRNGGGSAPFSYILNTAAALGATGEIIIYLHSAVQWGFFDDSTIFKPTTDLTWHVLEVYQDATNKYIAIDGAVSSGAKGTAVFGTADIKIGGNASANSRTDGHLSEVLIYDSNLSSEDKTLIRDYLTNKYAI